MQDIKHVLGIDVVLLHLYVTLHWISVTFGHDTHGTRFHGEDERDTI